MNVAGRDNVLMVLICLEEATKPLSIADLIDAVNDRYGVVINYALIQQSVNAIMKYKPLSVIERPTRCGGRAYYFSESMSEESVQKAKREKYTKFTVIDCVTGETLCEHKTAEEAAPYIGRRNYNTFIQVYHKCLNHLDTRYKIIAEKED